LQWNNSQQLTTSGFVYNVEPDVELTWQYPLSEFVPNKQELFS